MVRRSLRCRLRAALALAAEDVPQPASAQDIADDLTDVAHRTRPAAFGQLAAGRQEVDQSAGGTPPAVATAMRPRCRPCRTTAGPCRDRGPRQGAPDRPTGSSLSRSMNRPLRRGRHHAASWSSRLHHPGTGRPRRRPTSTVRRRGRRPRRRDHPLMSTSIPPGHLERVEPSAWSPRSCAISLGRHGHASSEG